MSLDGEGSAEISRLQGEGLLRYVERKMKGISNQDAIDSMVASNPDLTVVPEDPGKVFLDELHKQDSATEATATNWEAGRRATGSTAQVMTEGARQAAQTEIANSTKK